MKLFYYRYPEGSSNFGDHLNPWLWEQLLPDILDEDENTIFVGIGTVLNSDLLPKAHRTAVFSSGVGYGTLPKVESSWSIYCVRGPLSAQALGVRNELAVTDGAILVRRLFNTTNRKVTRFAYMPHYSHAEYGGQTWNSICKDLGFGYIDPRWPVEQVLSSINQTEILLTEAMHGAIVADAFRVHWIPINTGPHILDFKWQDWCLSVDVEYQPRYISPPHLRLPWSRPGKKRYAAVWEEQPPEIGVRSSVRHWVKKKLVAAQLNHIAKTSPPTLSSDTRIEQLTVELEERLQQFRDDVAAGYFHHYKFDD
jgi:succinoglycan biosynthesis protein ExoV